MNTYLITNLCYALFCLTLIGCTNSSREETPTNKDLANPVSWIDKHRKPVHPDLLSFSYEKADRRDLDREHVYNERSGDTLIAIIYSSVWVSCPIIGDISVSKDEIELQYDHAYNSADEPYTDEGALIKFIYKVLDNGDFTNKTFTFQKAKLMKE